jgi:hypothetical protein
MMSTFKSYLIAQAITFVVGIVGPIFLIAYFAFQPDPTLKWMYWWGLFITAADVLIALGLTYSSKLEPKPKRQSRQSTTS